MLIIFECKQCRARLEVDTGAAGSTITCPRCKASLVVPRAKLGPGTTVGGFRIKRLLGKGGMGEVYLARQLSMDRDVALKILPAKLTLEEQTVQRFLQEVRLAARLEHPHIVRAYEAGEDSGVYYLAMSYVRGQTLAELLAGSGVFKEQDALAVIRRIAQALSHAWDKFSILHRDIKPSNIIMDEDGDPKLTDMGLSKSLEDHADMTLSGTVMGTPNYMSPEQAQGREHLDYRADMYSLGATLYHMVSGSMPFQGSSVLETLRKQATETLPDPREFNPNISEACVALMEVMLAKNPADRHASWKDLIADLGRVGAGTQSSAKLPSAGQSMLLRKPPGKRARAAGAIPKRSLVLGKSTLRKLHGRNHARHHPHPKPAPKRSSSTSSILTGVIIFLLILGAGAAVLVFQQYRKRALRRAALAARHARAKPDAEPRVQPSPPKPEEPPPDASVKPADPKLAALRSKLDKAVEYAETNPDSFITILARFEELRTRAQGTALEKDVREHLARHQRRQRDRIDSIIADLKTRSDALRAHDKTADAAALFRNYTGALAAETKQQREMLAASLEPKTAAPEVARTPSSSGQASATNLNGIADALLRRDFETVRGRIRDSGTTAPAGVDPAQWKEIQELATRVVTTHELILQSLKRDIGKEVPIQFTRDTIRVSITAVEGTTVIAEEVLRAGGKKKGSVARNFTLADLSVQEKFSRLGKEETPDRCVMRGLLAYDSEVTDASKQHFERSESELGKVLCARVDALQAQRVAKTTARNKADLEASATQALRVVLTRAGITGRYPEMADLVLAIRKKTFAGQQVKAGQRALAAFRKQFSGTELAEQYAEVLGLLDKIVPDIPLHYDQEMLDARVEKLKKDNPKEIGITSEVFETKDDILLLRLGNLRGVENISAVAGLPIREAYLGRTGVHDLSPLKGVPLTRLFLYNTGVVDLTPLQGMPLRELNINDPRIKELTALQGMPLEKLSLCSHHGFSRLSDLAPLKGMPLQYLNLNYSNVSDLSPLEGMPLKHLDISYAPVRDLSPLKGMPLEALKITYCQFIRDLSPLKDIEGLKVQR